MFGLDIAESSLAGHPDVPVWKTIDPTKEGAKAIAGNQSNLAADEKLAAGVNTFNQDQMLAMLRKAIPGFDAIQGSTSSLIQSELKGEIPPDVVRAIQRNSAAAAVSGGTEGSDFAANRTLRDLGLTSLDLTQKGITAGETWLKNSAMLTQPQLFNLSSMFISPQQQFEMDFQNQEAQFQRDWMNNQITWASSTGVAAAQEVGEFNSVLQSAGRTAMGFGMGAAMGGGAGAGGGGAGAVGGDTFNPSQTSATGMVMNVGGGR